MNKSYIICTIQRSGSTYLCDLLNSTKLLGFSTEHFVKPFLEDKVARTPEAVGKALREIQERGTTRNGVFGIKIMMSYLDVIKDNLSCMRGLEEMSIVEMFNEVFTNPHYIYLERRDVLRQAISNLRSNQTHVTNVRTEEQYKTLQEKNRDISYSRQRLDNILNAIEIQKRKWYKFFEDENIKPYKIYYEDFVDNYERIIYEILDYLKVSHFGHLEPRSKYRKLSDSITEEWIIKYRKGD